MNEDKEKKMEVSTRVMHQSPRCQLLVVAAATPTPQVKDMIGGMRRNNHAARAALTLARGTRFFHVVAQRMM